MNIRPKTIRRVSILLVIILIVGGGIASFWWIRVKQINHQIDLLREQGMNAYLHQDYSTAREKLASWYTQRKNDTTGQQYEAALFAYGDCLTKVPAPDGSDTLKSIDIFRSYTQMDPKNFEVKRRLLQMETPISMYAGPAMSLANDLLQQDSTEPETVLVALKSLAAIYFQQQRYQESLDAAKKYTELNHTDLEVQHLVLDAMKANGNSPTEMHARADALAKKYPDDPRFMIVQAWAYEDGMTPDENLAKRDQEWDAAKKLVLAAAQKNAPDDQDAQFVKMTVSMLDQIPAFDEALQLLQRTTARISDPDLERMLVQRLWQTGKYTDVVDRLAKLDPASSQTSADLIAFKAMSLYSLKKTADANALQAALAARTNDEAAACWAIAIKTNFNFTSTDPKAYIAQFQDALKHNPDNPYVRSMLADSYRQADEIDLALQAWRLSARQARSWAYPFINIAQVLTLTGQGSSPEALDAAKYGMLASKIGDNLYNNSEAVVAEIMVGYAHLQTTHDPTESAKLLTAVIELQKSRPGEPNTLPIYVDLLATNDDHNKAVAIIQDAEKQPGTDGETLLLKLVGISRKDKLGLENSLYDAIEHHYGMTPRLALERASEMFTTGKGTDGLNFLLNAKAKAKNDPAGWDRTICIYREATGDPGAAAAWKALGNAYPNDLPIQSAIVSFQNSAWTDRDFMKQSIDRLQALDSDETGWKIGRARWLLDSNDPDKDIPAAIVQLTQVVQHNPKQSQPHRLLAIAYEKLAQTDKNDKDRQANLTNAANEWKQTADLTPNSPQILFHLIHALNENKQGPEAQKAFDRFADLPNLPPDLVIQAATIMNDEGQPQRAEKILLAYSSIPNAKEQVLRDAALAMTYRRENRSIDAAKLYFTLANSPNLDVMTINAAAEFFGAQHDLQAAHKFLDRLENTQLTASQRHLLLAGFDEQYVSLQSATEEYDAAAKAAPDDVKVPLQQIGFLVRHQLWPQAQACLNAAITQWPQDDHLSAYKTLLTMLPRLPNANKMEPFLKAITKDPQNPAGNQMLAILTVSPPLTPDATLQALNDLLGKYPNFQPLYEVTIAQMTSMHLTEQAVALAARLMEQFSDSGDAARVAATVYGNAERWNEALNAARQWRLRGTDNPVFADSFIAAAYIRTEQPQQAVDVLAPYMPDAMKSPEVTVNIITQYADALIRSGSESDAASLMLPLAQKSALFRIRWLNLAVGPHQNAASALLWIDQIRPLLQADSFQEQVALGQTYYLVGQKFGDTKAFALARDTFKPLVGNPKMDVPTLLLLGAAAGNCHDNAYAEKTYRSVLASNPHNPDAQNNLADLLRHQGDAASLNEAESLAQEACNAPANDLDRSNYLDTLARIQAQQNRISDAIATFQQGIKLMPNNLSILVGLADMYARNNQIDKSANCLNQIDSILSHGQAPTGELADELQTTRARVRKSSSNSSNTPATSSLGNGR